MAIRAGHWAAFGAAIVTAGCSTPFGQSTAIDWSGRPTPGTIAVSDPKEYRREALINERAKEAAWLDQLLEDSKTIEFKPELAREIETISAVSGALGLNFDPAAGLTYRRSRETGDIQQQIDVTRLQLQLDQLKQDAAVIRANLGSQTQPVNADVSKLATSTPAASTTAATTSATDQLKAAIDRLTSAMSSSLAADGKPAAFASTGTNPADTFRDRAAYRDMLKSARNAASLDELHDADGDALLRLNFHATVFPDRRRAAVPGVIQAKVVQRQIDDVDRQRVYAGWLDYLNGALNVEQGATWRTDPDLLRSSVSDLFDIVQFRYPSPDATAAAPKPAPAGGHPAAAPPADVCGGLVLDAETAMPASCSSLTFAAPKMRGFSAQEGAYSDLAKYLDFFNLATDEPTEIGMQRRSVGLLATRRGDLVTGCGLPHVAAAGVARPDEVNDLYMALELARIRIAGGLQLLALNDRARAMLQRRGLRAETDPRMRLVFERVRRAEALLSSFEAFAYAGCKPSERSAYRGSAGQLFVPDAFGDLLTRSDGRVTIYEVGPRDLVQQVSTVARSANSLALAVSVAASAPASGIAANAAGSYSRQAMGRAAAFERVPAVVGYSVRAADTFGWVIGPLATLDPKGRVSLDQSLREYDLTVDLSVPSWWPSFDLETVTAWAPNPRDVSGGSLSAQTLHAGREPLTTVQRRIRRTLNTADYAILTSQLANHGAPVPRRATLAGLELAGQSVDACRATAVLIRGENVWRSSLALLNGVKLDAGAISVTPDMGGVILDVPATDALIGDVPDAQLRITLLTPYGSTSAPIDHVRKPKDGCDAAAKKAPEGPSVGSITPSAFQAPGAVDLQVIGAKLDQVTRVTLNGQEGKLVQGKAGKSLKVSFTAEQTQSLPVSRTVPVSFYKGDDDVVDRTVEVTANAGGK